MRKSVLKLYLLSILSILLLPSISMADTVINGGDASGVWTKENSPYIIRNYVRIASGYSLTIEPGVVIKMSPDSSIYVSQSGSRLQIGKNGEERVIITSIDDPLTSPDSTTTPSLWNSIGASVYSSLTIENTDIRYGGKSGAVIVDEYSGVSLDNVSISKSEGTLVHIPYVWGYLRPSANIINSKLEGGSVGIFADYYSFVSMASSSITGQSDFGAKGYLNASNNWWGDASGPYNLNTNPNGKGVTVESSVTFSNWLDKDPYIIPTVVNKYSNIMFLPGIMGSDLYKADGSKCWITGVGIDEYDCIKMNSPDSPRTLGVTTKNVVSEYPNISIGLNIYKSMLSDLNNWQSEYGIIATSTPYDWRYGIEHIVNYGYDTGNGIDYNIASGTPYLVKKFSELASSSSNGKVTIVAHSMGGLVAKALINKLSEYSFNDKVDQVIFVATPQLGTPKAVSTILHGKDGGIDGGVLSDIQSRGLAQNMLSSNELLPSLEYFNNSTGTIINFSTSTNFYDSIIQNYGTDIKSKQALDSYLNNVKWGVPADDDLNRPYIVSQSILNTANAFHNIYDNMIISSSTKIISISGIGLDTVTGIKYEGTSTYDNIEVPKVELITSKNGDGTVVVDSARYCGGNNCERYYVDIEGYNNQGFTIKRNHSSILEIPSLREVISGLVRKINNISSEFVYSVN